MDEAAEIEVFIILPRAPALLSWVAERLGSIRLIDGYEDIRIYRAAPSDVAITVTPAIEGGEFTSILFIGDKMPWHTDLECARDAATALNAVVRCTPQDQGQRDTWIEVSSACESLVRWEDPPPRL